MNQLTFSVTAINIGIACIVCAYFTWILVVNLYRQPSGWSRMALEWLRWLIVMLILSSLFRPEWVEKSQDDKKPVIAVLSDRSRSMTTGDIQSTDALISRAQWLTEAINSEVWAPLLQQSNLRFLDFSPVPAASEFSVEGTNLSDPLESILKDHPRLRSVLVLSDGDWNLGDSPELVARKYRSRGVPIFSAVVGRDTPLPDLSIEEVRVPGFGLLGEQVAIGFRIRSTLPRDVNITVTLKSDSDNPQSRSLEVPAFTETQDSFLYFPETEGERTLAISIPVEPEEIASGNNEKEFKFSVRKETLKVLVIDSLPRWEYRYLRNALERDPGVEMSCLLFHPGMGPGAGKHYLPSFPDTREALSPYDVIFLGDVGIGDGELSLKDAELIRGLVEQQSSGLVFVPGRRGRLASLIGSPLEELLPVQVDVSKPNGYPLQNENPILLTTQGSGHLLTRFEMLESENARLWENLPGFFWSAPVLKSRPGTEVLGVHGSLRNQWGRLPMLVTKSVGSGHVLFMGTDGAWRWRRGVEDKYHYRLWSQVVRWMAHRRNLSEKEGIRLSFSPENPNAGDRVFLQASILNRAGFPLDDESVKLRLLAPDGSTEQLTLERVSGGWGVYEGDFISRLPGEHQLTMDIPNQGRKLETGIQIMAPTLEKVGQPARRQVLSSLAETTGGMSASFGELTRLVEALKSVPEPEEELRKTRLWAHPIWGGILLLLLSIYWIGRKLSGLV
ncbi:MAG: hypothetical protein LR011_05640 [Verrucomicrobia bacterium]|nr:hypothetical protein [Verrucomicrobiota bacterium]